ncbi:aquaporin [Modestobacter sp. URMC 112]
MAEFLGSAGLVAVVVGSGIAAQRLSTDAGLRLLENALVTGAALAALILVFGPVSGGHINPVVTLADRVLGGVANGQVAVSLPAQFAGGAVGAIAADLMFDLPAVSIAATERTGGGLWLPEVAAAYWWGSSTSVANPQAAVARMLSNGYAGIPPSSVPSFVLMQVIGTAAAVAVAVLLYPQVDDVAADVVVLHETPAPPAPAARPDPGTIGAARRPRPAGQAVRDHDDRSAR